MHSYEKATGGKIDLTNVSEIGEYCFAEYSGNSMSEYSITENSLNVYNLVGGIYVAGKALTNLIDVYYNENLNKFERYCFYQARIRNVIDLASVGNLEICKQAFYESTIKSFHTARIVNIGVDNYQFGKCSYLIDISFGNTKMNLTFGFFYNDYRLSDISFELGDIAQSCFASCVSLEEIRISDGNIGKTAFSSALRLNNIFVGGSSYR